MGRIGHLILWPTLIAVLITIGFYVHNFSSTTPTLSSKTTDWGVFGDYFGGVLNPVIAFSTLCATLYIAKVAHDFEQRRKQESSMPVALIMCSDYEDRIKVFIENVGVGPLAIKRFDIFKANELQATKNLIDLMPDAPEGILWTFFTLSGPRPFIYQDNIALLLQLDGELNDRQFCEFRDQVRRTLKDIEIKLEYSDIYGNKKEPVSRKLDEAFGRHFAPIGRMDTDEAATPDNCSAKPTATSSAAPSP